MSQIKQNQNVFDLTLQEFGTLENMFSDVLIPNKLDLNRTLKSGQELNIDAKGKQERKIKSKIEEQRLIMTNGEIEVPESSNWILAQGVWNDEGVWIDTAKWID